VWYQGTALYKRARAGTCTNAAGFRSHGTRAARQKKGRAERRSHAKRKWKMTAGGLACSNSVPSVGGGGSLPVDGLLSTGEAVGPKHAI
jgi:hypothetical protein